MGIPLKNRSRAEQRAAFSRMRKFVVYVGPNLGRRVVKQDLKTGKFEDSDNYSRVLQGKKSWQDREIKEAEKNIFERAVSRIPVVGDLKDIKDTAEDMATLIKNSKKPKVID